MRPIDIAGFEAKFRQNIDPWDYRSSPFEAFKRGVLLRACGDRLHGRGLELACAIGENSSRLASRCLRLLAVDSSLTALAEAQRNFGKQPRLQFAQARLPQGMPRGPFDLIVASEIGYYLPVGQLTMLLRAMARELAPGGRVVLLHHFSPFDDAAQPPFLAQRRMTAFFGRTMRVVFRERHMRFEAAAFQKPGMTCDREDKEC